MPGRLVVALVLVGCASSRPAPAPAAPTKPSADETVVAGPRFILAKPYFRRLRDSVAAAWHPESVLKGLSPERRLSLAKRELETTVNVALATDGSIVKLEVTTSSGVAELDAEALRAFQSAAPFGPTPKVLPTPSFRFGFGLTVNGASVDQAARLIP